MSKGLLVVARNNRSLDYIKQASFLADRAKQILNLPTSIITDSVDYIEKQGWTDKFDNIIPLVYSNDEYVAGSNVLSKYEDHNTRRYFDGAMYNTIMPFKNGARSSSYDISPYDETILIDTDILLLDDNLKHCFESSSDFMIYRDHYDLAGFRPKTEFSYISDAGVKFYWATVVFFRKTPENKIFFDLVQHIQDNWYHYRTIFQIPHQIFRNDHAFSIAIHIMNGYQDGDFATPMPGKLYFTTDKDILWKFDGNKIVFLLEKENHIGEYTLASWKDITVHVMNKFSLERMIDEYYESES